MTTLEIIQQSLGTVTLQETGQTVEIVQPVVQIVEVAQQGPTGGAGAAGSQGPQGPAGPPGSGADTTYTHDQATPSAEWIITHNLGRYPSVITVDSAGTEQDGDVVIISANQLKVVFVLPFGGKAYLN